MRLDVKATVCQAYGLCKDEADDLIELDEWGYPIVVDRDLDEDTEIEEARAAIDACPIKALRLLGEG